MSNTIVKKSQKMSAPMDGGHCSPRFGKSCLLGATCIENPRNPCPPGHGCSCRKPSKAVFIAEYIINRIIVFFVASTIGGGFNPLVGLAAICRPPGFFFPGPSDLMISAAVEALWRARPTCVCQPLSCVSNEKSGDCELEMFQDAKGMTGYNPLWCVPPNGKKCEGSTSSKCKIDKCSGSENGSFGRQGSEIRNCQQKDISSMTTQDKQRFGDCPSSTGFAKAVSYFEESGLMPHLDALLEKN